MTWMILQLSTVVYLGGLTWIQRRHWQLMLYMWGVLGFIFLFIHLAILQQWHITFAGLEAKHVQALLLPFGIHLQFVDATTFLVPDSSGWSGLNIGIECSTIIEMSIFVALVLFYPKLTLSRRWWSLAVGIVGTYLLNLLRIMIIVLMIVVWGKPAVPLAHTVVGRLVYFVGVVGLYWYLLTKPTLYMVQRFIEVSGRAVH